MRARAAIALAALLALAGAAPAAGQSWRTVAVARQSRGQESLDISVKYAVGRFELKRGADELLYRLDSKYDEETFRLRSNYMESDGRGRLRVDLDGGRDIEVKNIKDYDVEAGSLGLAISGAIPVALDIELGAAEADLDLGGLKLQRIRLETGASKTRVRFSEPSSEAVELCSFKAGAASFRIEELGNSGCRKISFSGGVGAMALDFFGEWSHDADGDIEVGLGTLEIRVPAELGVRIERSTFLMSFDAPGFVKRNGAWLSQNWDTAAHHLTLRISGALGTIRVARL